MPQVEWHGQHQIKTKTFLASATYVIPPQCAPQPAALAVGPHVLPHGSPFILAGGLVKDVVLAIDAEDAVLEDTLPIDVVNMQISLE